MVDAERYKEEVVPLGDIHHRKVGRILAQAFF
jgi:hypothetical protein